MTGSLADYYHWEETDKGIRIYMHAGMVDRLQAEVLQSAGKEVGGILLGRVEEDRGKPIAIIDGFVPVPCSNRGGPQYDLSGARLVRFEIKRKDKSINLRLSEELFDAVRARAARAGLPYQRFIRLTLEQALGESK